MSNGEPHLLTTWQWLGVIAVIVGATVGLDQRIQWTVRTVAEANDVRIIELRDALKDLAESRPPEWLKRQVVGNSSDIREIKSQFATLRVSIAELASATNAFSKELDKRAN